MFGKGVYFAGTYVLKPLLHYYSYVINISIFRCFGKTRVLIYTECHEQRMNHEIVVSRIFYLRIFRNILQEISKLFKCGDPLLLW